MVKYSKECKEQALLLSDDIGVKKGAEQQGLNYSTLTERRKTRRPKAREERIASDKTPLNEQNLAMQREIQELKKARFNCVNQLLCALISARIEHLPKFTLCSAVQF